MSELKPCPFCGGEAELTRDYDNEGSDFKLHIVLCCSCWAQTVVCHTEAEAIEAWNTRAERTCEYYGDEISGGCSVCRGWLDPACAYCPSCGAKVVQDAD